MRRCGAKWTASAHARAPASCARSAIRLAGVTVPTAFDARVKATIRVRDDSAAPSADRSIVRSGPVTGTVRTNRPWSSATRSHGLMLASWSSTVVTISSPGSSVRATACANMKLSVDMFGPNAISSAAPPTNSAAARRAATIRSSDDRLVGNTPPRFALCPYRYSVIAAPTTSGTCDPPGPSRYACAPANAGKRARTAVRSNGGIRGPYWTARGRSLDPPPSRRGCARIAVAMRVRGQPEGCTLRVLPRTRLARRPHAPHPRLTMDPGFSRRPWRAACRVRRPTAPAPHRVRHEAR